MVAAISTTGMPPAKMFSAAKTAISADSTRIDEIRPTLRI
jgi:hypothetical protein